MLLSKELKSLLNTSVGIIFLLVFILSTGILLWLIPGKYNIPEAGYASLDVFFSLVPVLLVVLIPGLSGRAFADEKNKGNLDVLLTRPVSLWRITGVKFLAIFLVVLLALLLTFVYVISLYWTAMPVGNIDRGAIIGSYLGMIFLSVAFIFVAVFASSLTSGQVTAFILSLVGCVGLYYGFELLSGLFSSGKSQLFIRQWGIYSHVTSMQRGVLDSRDVIALLSIGALFYLLTVYVLSVYKNKRNLIPGITILLFINLIGLFAHFRLDLTTEKRYTISTQSKRILTSLEKPLQVEVYLSGDLNAGFTRLKQATIDMLSEFEQIAPGMIDVHIIDPYEPENKEILAGLNENGMPGIAVNERNKEGKIVQKVVFPWVMIKSDGVEIPTSILVHQKGKSGEENLNASIENLEYQLISGIYASTHPEGRKVAFIEGHGELDENMTGDISDALSVYYQVDRGELTKDFSTLKKYEVIVIAGTQYPFAEWEKFMLDQYLMQGGKILFLINGVRLQLDLLATTGESPSMANEIKLDDLLFTYGVRINPVLIQDAHCLTIPVQTGSDDTNGDFKPLPWYYAPILNPSPDHPVTKDVMYVKSEFVSSLSFVGNQPEITKTPLLASSEYAHIVQVPEMVTLASSEEIPDLSYFNEKDLPVAALLEGRFSSLFYRRPVPEGLQMGEVLTQSIPTKIIVIGSDEIIRNEVVNGQQIPLGYDSYSGIRFGNKDFLVNAINYLTDDANLMSVKNKHLKIRLLDNVKIEQYGKLLAYINILVPVSIALILFILLQFSRKKKYFL